MLLEWEGGERGGADWGKMTVTHTGSTIPNHSSPIRIPYVICLFDSLCPSQHFSVHVGMVIPGKNQYKAEDKESCSRTQCNASGGGLNPQPAWPCIREGP